MRMWAPARWSVVLVVAVAAVLLSTGVEGLPHAQDTNEVVSEYTGSAQVPEEVLIDGDGDPNHNIAEDPSDPYEESQNPFTAKIDQNDDPMTVESPVAYKGDDWEKFALRHETEPEMDPSADDEHLDKYWKSDMGEPDTNPSLKVPNEAGLLDGMNKVCEKLDEHLCGDGSCSKHCPTVMPDTGRDFTVGGSDHQPEMAKAVNNIHHHAHFRMSTENNDVAKTKVHLKPAKTAKKETMPMEMPKAPATKKPAKTAKKETMPMEMPKAPEIAK